MLDWIHELVGDAPWLPAAMWVISIIVAGGFIIRSIGRAWPKLRRFVRTMDALAQLPPFMDKTTATLAKQDVQIEQIHHEVNYNNGSSVKDSIARVELGVKGLYERLDATDGHMDEIEKTIPRNQLGQYTKKKEEDHE